MTIDSPCHHCSKCPCKEHDTCGDYLEYRAAIEERGKQKRIEWLIRKTTLEGIERCKKWRNIKK